MKNNKLKLIYSALIVIMTLAGSKVLGFVRQAVLAGAFGASDATDAFFISNEFVINVTGAVMAAMITALVTIYVEKKNAFGKEQGDRVISGSICASVLCALVFGICMLLLAPVLAKILAPGLSPSQQHTVTTYIRILCGVPVLTVCQGNLIAVLNAQQRFAPSKLYGVIYNPIAILVVLLIGARFGISIMLAVTYVAQLLFCIILYCCSRSVYRFHPVPLKDFSDGKPLLKLLLPVLISNLVLQVNVIGAKAICSLLGESFPSFFSYAYTLEQLVTGTFTAAMSLILLPSLAEFAVRADYDGLSNLVRRFVACVFQVLAFAAMIAFVFSEDIVSIVYMRGAFTADNMRMTASALRGFALGFPIIAIRDTLRQVHFTSKHVRTTIIIDAVTAVMCVLFALILHRFIGVLGVSLSITLAAVCSIILLTVSAKKKGLVTNLIQVSGYLKCFAALAVSCVVCILCGRFIGGAVLLRLAAGTCLGGFIYLIGLLILRCEVAQLLLQLLRNKAK